MCLVTVFIFTSLVLLSLYYRYRRAGRMLSKIPGPIALPIVGNAFSFLLPPEKLFKFMRTLPKTYGDVVQAQILDFRFVNLYNPEDIEKIISSVRHSDKNIPYNYLKPWLGEGLATSSGLKWQQRRKLLTQAFHFNILKKYTAIFIEQTKEFLDRVEVETDNTQTDVLPLISSTTLRITCETAMGTSMHGGIESVTHKYFKAIEIIGQAIVLRLCKMWLYFNFVFQLTPFGRKHKASLLDLHTLTNRIIEERRALVRNTQTSKIDEENVKKGRLAMLDLLLEHEKLGNIDMEGVREEVDTFLFGGHDTTATALSFLLVALANDSPVQEKIYEEMQNIFGDSDRSVTMEDLNEMSYLECCIKESLRLYPSVPCVSRYISEEMTIGGYTIPAYTHYQIYIYELHQRADIYPEPEKFVPERFLPENCVKRHPYAYIPFSAGPRNCIGQKFAMLEMKTLVSSLIRRFKIHPVTRTSDLRFKADLMLRTYKQPLYVRFGKRLNK